MSKTAWNRLRNKEITCEQALKLLISQEKQIYISLLDQEVSNRFFREFTTDRHTLPPIIPLLLWQNKYYLGCYQDVGVEDIKKMSDRTFTEIEIIPIAEKSYRLWFHSQNFDQNKISSVPLIDPITGEQTQEDISETTEIYLAKAQDQIGKIKTIISGALRNRASDIHLEPTPDGLRIRYRIDGVLRDITTLGLDVSRKVIIALKVMAEIDISESRRPQDGRIGEKFASSEEAQLGVDMRVSTLPCVGGEKAVIRLLPRKNPFSSMDKLGFSSRTLPIYRNWLKQPQGMIILTGPTGSGKTSTLYTSLQTIAVETVNVITVEDPVEYVLSRITQTQVNEAAGMTFAAGLRAILRQDPDIIMVGEIRDHETAETAVRAALTGHLVLTTLHTNDAAGAIPRIKDIGPDTALISDALLGIVAQRLARRNCPHCSEIYHPNDEELKILGIDRKKADLVHFKKGKGCAKCFNSGYLGREAIIEVIDIDQKIREIIYDGTMTELHKYLKESNYPSFLSAARGKVLAGITTIEEVQRVLPRNSLMQFFN